MLCVNHEVCAWRCDVGRFRRIGLAGDLYAVPGYVTSTQYEADGQTKSITYANGVTTDFEYSSTRRSLTRVATTLPNTNKLIDYIHTRDDAGRITAIDGLPRRMTGSTPMTSSTGWSRLTLSATAVSTKPSPTI